ncbi:dethiobiotin synthetase [Phycicoccus badiiscoriae]|uniref:ATP-dependent dethiobiotin synthetase BioD n=1 Tax=Pedococcus badiiscoriae TaxID=642776 RepID=A0A852WRD7_9MICO|nr:dethiobiotin synthetase [Pedococcus badiiscoriae]
MPDPISLPKVVVVTGTSTDVGKTVVTAALTAMLRRRGATVAVVKPLQTGVTEAEDGDLQVVQRLLGQDPGVTFHEFVRLEAPLAPDAAARLQEVTLPPVAQHARTIAALANEVDVVLVEGAGGLLVRLDSRGGTLADLGTALRYKGTSTGYVLVASPSLGTLNHTALTAEALAARDLPLLGVVVGSYPEEPDLAERSNLEDLPRVAGAPLLGSLPAGAGGLTSAEFVEQAPGWLLRS